MLTFTNNDARALVKEKFPDHAEEIDSIDFQPFPHLEESVVNDINFLKSHPLVQPGTTITGWVYEVETGRVIILFYSTNSPV